MKSYTHFRKKKDVFSRWCYPPLGDPRGCHRAQKAHRTVGPCAEVEQAHVAIQWPKAAVCSTKKHLEANGQLWPPVVTVEATGNWYKSHDVSINVLLEYFHKYFFCWNAYTFFSRICTRVLKLHEGSSIREEHPSHAVGNQLRKAGNPMAPNFFKFSCTQKAPLMLPAQISFFSAQSSLRTFDWHFYPNHSCFFLMNVCDTEV